MKTTGAVGIVVLHEVRKCLKIEVAIEIEIQIEIETQIGLERAQ